MYISSPADKKPCCPNAPRTSCLRRVDARVHDADHVVGAHTEHMVGAAAVAAAVVAAGRGAKPDDAGLGHRLPVTVDGVLVS